MGGRDGEIEVVDAAEDEVIFFGRDEGDGGEKEGKNPEEHIGSVGIDC